MSLPLVTRVECFRVARLVSFLLAATSGLGIFYKAFRVLLQKTRWWVWKSIIKNHWKDRDETVALTALAAVNAASSVATEVAKLSRVMLAIRSEGRQHAMNIVRVLQAQSFKLTEAERMTRGIMEEIDRRKQASATNDEHVKTLHPSTTNNGHAQSPSFSEVMAMLERGETPPGIKKINDEPPVPNQLPSLSCLPPKPKPWEKSQRAKSNHMPYMHHELEDRM